jgi:hypothetical protein
LDDGFPAFPRCPPAARAPGALRPRPPPPDDSSASKPGWRLLHPGPAERIFNLRASTAILLQLVLSVPQSQMYLVSRIFVFARANSSIFKG